MISTSDPTTESDFQTRLRHKIHFGIGSSGGADSKTFFMTNRDKHTAIWGRFQLWIRIWHRIQKIWNHNTSSLYLFTLCSKTKECVALHAFAILSWTKQLFGIKCTVIQMIGKHNVDKVCRPSFLILSSCLHACFFSTTFSSRRRRYRSASSSRDNFATTALCGIFIEYLCTEFPIPLFLRFRHVLFWEFPCPAWAVASCSSGPQAGELLKTKPKNLYE